MDYIWTLWWQGEENAPPLVKRCISSIKKNSGKATVIVLDKNTITKYIDLPVHIKRKFEDGMISITHLSDIIRFKLLYKYGGLWLDSTVFVSREIPNGIYEYSFYSIKGGTNDTKNISRNRWTAFVIGGHKDEEVFRIINRMFDVYWEVNDTLICYFWIDFLLNEIYNRSTNFRMQIDNLPNYMGNVFGMAGGLYGSDNTYTLSHDDLFNKLSWKDTNKKVHHRIKSLLNHVSNLFDIRMIDAWGLKLVLVTFLNNILRTFDGVLPRRIANYYNSIVSGYWEDIYRKACGDN